MNTIRKCIRRCLCIFLAQTLFLSYPWSVEAKESTDVEEVVETFSISEEEAITGIEEKLNVFLELQLQKEMAEGIAESRYQDFLAEKERQDREAELAKSQVEAEKAKAKAIRKALKKADADKKAKAKAKKEKEKAWTGKKLNSVIGTVQGPSGKETFYNLPMRLVITADWAMGGLGYSMKDYWVRKDGVKMLGKYIMVASDLNRLPRGTIVETSLGTGMVCDACESAMSVDYTWIDIAVTW